MCHCIFFRINPRVSKYHAFRLNRATQRSKRFFFSHNVNECMLQVVLPTTVHNYTIDGLATSTFYDIQLLANNSDGTSLPSPTVTALTRYAFGESPQLQITFPHC